MGSLLALLAYKENNNNENIVKVPGDIDAGRIHTDEGRKEVESGKVSSDEPEETDPLEIPSDGDESSEPVPGPDRSDEDDTSTEVPTSSQTQHPPLGLSDAEEEEEGGEEEEEDNNDAVNNDEPDAKDEDDEEEEDTKAISCTTSTTDTWLEEPLTTKSSLTSKTDATDDIEGARDSTSLPPQACPGNGPTPVTVQVENAFAVQVGNGNVLTSAETEGSGNATLTPGADAFKSHSQAEIVAVYINNCDVVQVGNHNKVIPQENAFVKVCCELGIDPERANDILARLRHDDVMRQFATKMADSFNVTCRIRAATRGCILLELEVPTEADRLQLLRMARDGTFQQVLLETFLPEFAAEGRAVNMNLAIGVRNPSQAVVEELQGAVTSSDKEDVKVIEIPGPPVTDGSSAPGQPESRSDQAEGQNQAENHVGLLEGPPDVDQMDVPDEDSPGVERSTPASDTDNVSQLTSLLRLLSEPGEDPNDQSPVPDDQISAANDQIPAADDQSPVPDDQHIQSLDQDDEHPAPDDLPPVDQRLETNDQRLEVLPQDDPDLTTDDQRPASDDQHLETDDQSYDHSVGYESYTQEEPNSEAFSSSAHPERTSNVKSSQVSERSGSEKTNPHASHTAPHVPAASAFEDDYSEMSTQLKKAVPVFNQPRKPRKPPVDPRTPLRRMPFRLVKMIAMELDPPGQLANWKDLAAYAGFSMQEISLFEMEYLKPGGSPTRALLNAWGTRNATVRDLLDVLRQIGLINVVDMLSKAESEDEEA